MEARVADIPIPFARTLRPELDALGPDLVFGYSAYIDIPMLSLGGKISAGSVDVVFYGDGREVARLSVVIAEQALGHTEGILRDRALKRDFINKTVRRPLHSLDGCQAPSALPADWPLSPSLSTKTDRTSANEYGSVVIEFLKAETKQEGFVLDMGAGLRKTPYPNVVNMDIYDYPSTDLLGIGEDLPFYDNVFDEYFVAPLPCIGAAGIIKVINAALSRNESGRRVRGRLSRRSSS
jgi:hypothetical protein